jgi:hypothetical protein
MTSNLSFGEILMIRIKNSMWDGKLSLKKPLLLNISYYNNTINISNTCCGGKN